MADDFLYPHDNSGGGQGPDDVVAWLHCELPTSIKPAKTSSTGGTADLSETDGGGPTARETITLHSSHALRIGRARANDLVIENPSVSRFHAVVSGSTSGVVLSDLSSLNGTFLNGRRISAPVDVVSGDILAIGPVKITIELSRGVAQPRERRLPEVDDPNSSTHAQKMSTTQVTVLVADICRFTALSQALAPQDIASMLNTWFSLVAKTVHDEAGEIDKYIGDCVMALWRGDKSTITEQAVRATRAAERIIAETKRLVASGVWKYETSHPWRCRVALNTGEALVGAVGRSGASDYTVLGDTVNIAFRLESLASAEGASLMMTGNTAKLVGDFISLRSLGEVILDGRKDTVSVYTLDTE